MLPSNVSIDALIKGGGGALCAMLLFVFFGDSHGERRAFIGI
jgi:hypothetical protein